MKKKKRITKKKLKTKKNKSVRRVKKSILVKSNTPFIDRELGNFIHWEKNNSDNKNNNTNKSFSPIINKELVPKTLNLTTNNLFGCFLFENLNINKLPNINVNNKCFPYENKKSLKNLLHNLSLSDKNINWENIKAPKQFQSNCWFNTLFMCFFISDKGRKFFKFFRQLMIEGKQKNGKKIEPEKLRNTFAYLNLAIEASLQGNDALMMLDTNEFIKDIYNFIPKKFRRYGIVSTGKKNNPLFFYNAIMKFLNNTDLNLIQISLDYKKNNNRFKFLKIPDILILEIFDSQYDNSSKFINNKKNYIDVFDTHNNKAIFKLDSVIIRDTEKTHFCSLLTINKKEFGFDGVSYRRLSKFKWNHLLNKNQDWSFEGSFWKNTRKHIKWNFKNGYQLLIYYRHFK